LEDLGFSVESRDKYIKAVASSYSSHPDVTNCFSSRDGLIAVCYGCQKEKRGLHIHALPTNASKIASDLAIVRRKVGESASKAQAWKWSVSELTGGHGKTVVAAVVTSIAALVSFFVKVNLPEPYFTLFNVAIVASLCMAVAYFILILVLLFVHAYYVTRIIRRS
jgi:hypothetical protein